MSLQDALQRAKLEQMLKQQEEILKRSEPKKDPSAIVKKLMEDDLENVLKYGGVSSVEIELDGKVKRIKISVKAKENTQKVPEFKFHVKSALGHTVFIQAKDRKTAQIVVNKLFGKGQYTVSASVI